MVIYIVLILLLQSTLPYVSAGSSQTYFARVINDEAYLLKSPLDITTANNVYFSLPETYFVELVDLVDDEFYLCNYISFSGYVKKNWVQAVAETPSNPYLENINFRVYSEMSRDMRTYPSTDNSESSQIVYIPLLSRNLTYYGKIKGKPLIDGRTDIWYYCKYSADQDYYGYVYSDFCDQETPIINNTEILTYIENPTFKPILNIQNSMPLNNNSIGIIIGILSIPALIFVFMIINGKNILTKEKIRDKEIKDY